MKAKKILSLVLALCMVLSVLSAGFVVANAAETDNPTDANAAETENTGGDKLAANVEPSEEAYAGANTDTDENTDENVGDSSTFWYGDKDYTSTLSSEEISLYLYTLEQHYSNYKDYTFTPTQVIATQSVSGGTVQAVLALTSHSPEVAEKATKSMSQEQKLIYSITDFWYTVFTFYKDSKGNLSLLKYVIIDPSDVKTLDLNTQNANAPWVIKEQQGSSRSASVIAAIQSYSAISLTPIASIAIEMNRDYENITYKYLCYGTVNGKTNLYVVTLKPVENSTDYEVTDVAYFDINQYITSKTGDDTTDDTKKSTTTDNDDSDVKKDTSSKSPKTGSNDFASAFAILFFVSCFAGVSAYKFSKKRG